jgi:hypothetical protein
VLDGDRRRLARLGKALGRKALQQVATVATPDTVLRWYRELVAKKFEGSKKREPGQPKKATEVVRLRLEMARRNPGWGYPRLHDALNNLGYDIGRPFSEMWRSTELSRRRDERGCTRGRPSYKAHLGAITGWTLHD